jgi:hypothetical protein
MLQQKVAEAQAKKDEQNAVANKATADGIGLSLAKTATLNAEAAQAMREKAMRTLAEAPPEMPTDIQLNRGEGITAGIGALMGMGAMGANATAGIATQRMGTEYKNRLNAYTVKVSDAERRFNMANADHSMWRNQGLNLELGNMANMRQDASVDLANARGRLDQAAQNIFGLDVAAQSRANTKQDQLELETKNRKLSSAKAITELNGAMAKGDWESVQTLLQYAQETGLDVSSFDPKKGMETALAARVNDIIANSDKMTKGQIDAAILDLERVFKGVLGDRIDKDGKAVPNEQKRRILDALAPYKSNVYTRAQKEAEAQAADLGYKKAMTAAANYRGTAQPKPGDATYAVSPFDTMGGPDGAPEGAFNGAIPAGPDGKPAGGKVPRTLPAVDDPISNRFKEGPERDGYTNRLSDIPALDKKRGEYKDLAEKMKNASPSTRGAIATKLEAKKKEVEEVEKRITDFKNKYGNAQAYPEFHAQMNDSKRFALDRLFKDIDKNPDLDAEQKRVKKNEIRAEFRKRFIFTMD